MTEVTQENYYAPELQMEYMGSTQYKAFQKCEAAALAELQGAYVKPTTPALLVGGYVDAYFSGEMEEFMIQHPEIRKRDGTLKADFVQANGIIQRMEQDELYRLLMSGKKQVIRTGLIAGVPFKIRIDSLLDSAICEEIVRRFPECAEALGLCDGAIVDQKVMRDLSPVWSEEERAKVSFIEAWGYDVQGAIYQEIEGNMLPFIVAPGTKEDSPDLDAFYIPYADLQEKLAEIDDNAPRYQAIKEGKIPPRRCEKCAYCRATKRLTRIRPYHENSEDTEVMF